MTRNLDYYKREDTAPEYAYVRVDFENGYHLALTMPRKLGHVRLLDTPEAFITTHDLGPDALGLSFDTFAARIANRARSGPAPPRPTVKSFQSRTSPNAQKYGHMP